MEATQLKQNRQIDISTIDQALSILNEAAKTSSDEITRMMSKDYERLDGLLSKRSVITPRSAHEGEQRSMHQDNYVQERLLSIGKEAAKKIDSAAHRSPWYLIGGTAAASAVLGYVLANRLKR